MVANLGSQGGDLRNLPQAEYLDLSSCVNRYGPSPAAQQILQTILDKDLKKHPYESAAELELAYAKKLNVLQGELIAGRGTTEFIWTLSKLFSHSTAAIPLPAYTDYIKAFPNCGNSFSDSSEKYLPSIEQLAKAMSLSEFVLISNPHNPTGIYLPRKEIISTCKKFPKCILCIDESYIDFLEDPLLYSVSGADLENLIILQSPSKFYGIAATRTGIAWTKNKKIYSLIKKSQDTWPVSFIDVKLAVAAMQDELWANSVRAKLKEDARYLTELLRSHFDIINPSVHFNFLFTSEYENLYKNFLSNGVIIRALGSGHGVIPGGIRIASPKESERDLLKHVFNKIL